MRVEPHSQPTVILYIAAIAFSLLGAGCSHSKPSTTGWPMFGHDARHSFHSEADTSTVKGVIKWKYELGHEMFVLPSVGADGTIYVGSSREMPRHRELVHALEAVDPDGKLKWKFVTSADVADPPAVDSQTIYFDSGTDFGLDGYSIVTDGLYALNLNGTQKWKVRGGMSVFGPEVIARDGTIYVGSSRRAFPGQKVTRPNDLVNYLCAYTPDGQMKWQLLVGASSRPAGAFATVDDNGTIYTMAGGTSEKPPHSLYALTPSGALKWKFSVTDSRGMPQIGADHTVYIDCASDSNHGELCALSPEGKLKWRFKTAQRMGIRSFGSDDTIYVGSDDVKNPGGTLYAIKPDGAFAWKFKVPKGSFAFSTTGGNGTIYAATDSPGDSNTIYALRPDGSLEWKLGIEAQIVFSVIGPDGTLYAGTGTVKGAAQLYAIY